MQLRRKTMSPWVNGEELAVLGPKEWTPYVRLYATDDRGRDGARRCELVTGPPKKGRDMRGRHRGLLKQPSQAARCAFKHHGIRSAGPYRYIFVYYLFVNIHLLQNGTLLQTSRNRLPPIKSKHCYNVR
jgi:hypothetical protein